MESDVSLESKSSSVILESDQGVEDNVVEAIVNKSDQYSSESDTNHQSFFITPKKKGNKQKIPSDSSSENADLTTSKMSFNNKVNVSFLVPIFLILVINALNML